MSDLIDSIAKTIRENGAKVGPGFTYTINNVEYKVPETLKFRDPQYMINQSVIDGLYKLLKCFMKLTNQNHLKIFATSGTLISAIRHKAFMPWDDDIDMGYLLEDHDKIKKLRAEFLVYGYNLIECTPGFVLQDILHPSVAMDLFMISFAHDKKLRYAAPIINDLPSFQLSNFWKKEWFIEDEVINLEKAMICDIEVWVPANPAEILKRHYAPSVLTEVCGVTSTKSHIFRIFQIFMPFVDKKLPNEMRYRLMEIALK